METIEIEGKTLLLSFPDEQKIPWIGEKQYIAQIQTAWTQDKDSNTNIQAPFNPRIIGRVGMGKSTLAYGAAKIFQQNSPSEIFVVHCSENMTPEQILIYEVKKNNLIEYHASPLVSAMVKGGICVIDECQYSSPEVWAAISSLLEQRYITSDVVGLKIYAHKNFRICFTQNYDQRSKAKNKIPAYISILLKPIININHPSRKHEMEVLKYFFPDLTTPILLNHLVDFLQSSHFEDRPYSIRDCINIIQYYSNLTPKADVREVDWNNLYKSLRQILDNQAIYFLNEQLNQSKDPNIKFKENVEEFDESSDEFDEKLRDFYENEEEFAEFIKDESEFSDDDDSFLFLEEESEEEEKNGQGKSRSDVSNAKYLRELRKKIRKKLLKKKDEDTKNKSIK